MHTSLNFTSGKTGLFMACLLLLLAHTPVFSYAFDDLDISIAQNDSSSNHILFITDGNRDSEQIAWLEEKGFTVETWWPQNTRAVTKTEKSALNKTDLIIIGRSPGSFSLAQMKNILDSAYAPMINNNMWSARNTRMKWFDTSTANNKSDYGDTIRYHIRKPSDGIFTGVDIDSDDSLAMYISPTSLLLIDSAILNQGNALVIAANHDQVAIARFTPGVEYYPGAGSAPLGHRTYWGFGNDASGEVKFFPLLEATKIAYEAEIQRLIALGYAEQPPINVSFITDDNQDSVQIAWLEEKGFTITKWWPADGTTNVSTEEIARLNNSDLVIIGRSPNSGSLWDMKIIIDKIITPLMSNNTWGSRSTRMKWFDSWSAFRPNNEGDTLRYHILDTDDDIFAGVTIDADDSLALYLSPNDYLSIPIDTLMKGNGEIIAANQSSVGIVRFSPQVEYYPGAESFPYGHRTYWGFGSDINDSIRFFPLTETGKIAYEAELRRLVKLGHTPAPPASDNAFLSGIQINGNSFSGFDRSIVNYTADWLESDGQPSITATVEDANATVTVSTITDFTTPVSITVTAEDQTTVKTYLISFNLLQAGYSKHDILFVGRLDFEGDPIIVDSLRKWGYTVDLVTDRSYNDGMINQTPYDMIYFSESMDSKKANNYGVEGFQLPAIIAEPYALNKPDIALGELTSTALTDLFEHMEIINDSIDIVNGKWASGEIVQVLDHSLNPQYFNTVYQYEFIIDPTIQYITLGRPSTGGQWEGHPSWVLIPGGQRNIPDGSDIIVQGFHAGVGYKGTAAFWEMTRRSVEHLIGKPNPDLLAYYKFEESQGSVAADSSGNGVTGKVEGNAQWATGKYGGSLLFDGLTSVNVKGLSLTSDSGSVVSWIQAYDGNIRTIFSGGDNTTGGGFGPENEYHIHLEAEEEPLWAGGELSFAGYANGFRQTFIWSDSAKGLENPEVPPVSPILLGDSAWHHVVTTWGNGKTSLYIDGELIAQKDYTAPFPSVAMTNIRLGSMLQHGIRGFVGKLDEMRIYSHSLSSQDIKLLYNPNSALPKIELSKQQIAENSPEGSPVGLLKINGVNNPEFSLPDTLGFDNQLFTIDGFSLRSKTSFNFEALDIYTIYVLATDGFGNTQHQVFDIAITDVADDITALTISSSTIPENMDSLTFIGNLSTTGGAGNIYSYELVADRLDNEKFRIVEDSLVSLEAFNYEIRNEYFMQVSVTDGFGNRYEEIITINVGDQNEAPTALALSNTKTDEHQETPHLIGVLSTIDEDAADTHTYSLQNENDKFQIIADSLYAIVELDYEKQPTYTINIQTLDSGGLSLTEEFTIVLNDVQDPLSNKSTAFSIYPVPVIEGTLNFSRRLDQPTNVEIIGLDGKAMLNISLQAKSRTLNLANLSPGIYLLRMSDRQGMRFQKKILVK